MTRDRFYVQIARNATRLGREVDRSPCGGGHHECGDAPCSVRVPALRGQGGGGSRAGLSAASTRGRVIVGFSQRSRNNMRWELGALDWRALGPRPAMVTLTYPGEWQDWAPDGPTVRRHVERFKSRWHRRWGEAIVGVWVREFQKRGAPHFHCYVGLPAGVSPEEYVELSERTRLRKSLERRTSKYEARRQAGFLTGEFGRWLTRAWSGSVGTPPTSLHATFGADVAPMFWAGSSAEFAAADDENWRRVAHYLWKESGKWGQKAAPEGFAQPGRVWGRWGVGLVVSEGELTDRAFYEARRMLLGFVRSQGLRLRVRGRDGLTAFGLGRDSAVRVLRLADELAMQKWWGRKDGVTA